ncbi:MAG: DUF2157 domain-containing protein [Actinobacteria bacterium]|nr:DUF2157 domain-containing protein [Actinomycetota bacterium]
MTNKRKSASALIDDYEASGKLSTEEARALREAPQWVISFTDIASFLGGAVIFVGLVWIVIALIQDLSQEAIDAALFIASAGTAALAYWLIRKGGRIAVLGECVVAVSTTAFAIGIALLLDIWNVHEDYILIIAALTALLIGIGVSFRTTFIGTIIIVAATQPFMAGIISEYFADTSAAPLVFVLSGTALIWYSQRNIGLQFVARAAGAVSIMFAAIGFSTWENSTWRPIVGLVIAALLFAYGASQLHLEIVAAGGFSFTVTTGVLAGRLFDSTLLQGLSVVATGVIIIALSLAISRKAKPVT